MGFWDWLLPWRRKPAPPATSGDLDRPPPSSEVQSEELDPTAEAERLIARGEAASAGSLLERELARQPGDWRPTRETPAGLEIAFWDAKEFKLYVAAHRDQRVAWKLPSYSKMLYLLAFLAVERKDHATAEAHVRRALELEPDHPLLLCELALAREHDSLRDALDAYNRATTARAWDSRSTARAHRGVGFTLIEIGALDGAEAAFRRSLEVEPGNEVALHELEIVREMRARGLTADDYRRAIERSGGPSSNQR